MGKLSKTRGDHFERELCTQLADELGRVVKRQLGQARDRGADILIPPFTIEAKRIRRLGRVYEWLAQAVAASAESGCRVPVVIARGDGHEAVAIVRLRDFVPLIREGLE